MKRIPTLLYLATLLLLLCAALVSCTEEPDLPDDDDKSEVLEPVFSIGTRAGLSGEPQHGDAYTLVSYNVGGTTSTIAFRNQISAIRQYGYYAYDDGVISGRTEGTLVPVAISIPGASDIPPFNSTAFYAPSSGISPLVINRDQAQALQAVPLTGLNPANNTGLYRTALIYPAIPMERATTPNLGYLAVFHIDTDIWASSPDDADGNPDTDDPFEIEVTANGQVYPFSNLMKLFPIKSAIGVSFYSEFFADNDPDMLNPLTQTFSITSLKLVNVGSNGWYNARTGIVYPNYNYGALPVTGYYAGNNWRTVYSSTEIGVNTDGTPIYPERGAYNYTDLLDPNRDGNGDDSMVVDESGNNLLPPKRPDYPDPTHNIRWSAEVPVFPSDYRGAENGGLTEVKPLLLRLELSVGGAQLKATVPIAMVMERGKKYNFYINVMSKLIGVSYNVSSWDKTTIGGGVGGDMIGYMDIDIEYKPGGWLVGGSGTDDIGN